MYACLIRQKDSQKQICVGCYGDAKQGVNLYWEDFHDNYNMLFSSEKQAWWAWYQFKRFHPDRTDGWSAKVEATGKNTYELRKERT